MMKRNYLTKGLLFLGMCVTFLTACGQENVATEVPKYQLITEQHIEDEYFSMEAPAEFVGNVGYQVELEEDGAISIQFVVGEYAVVRDEVLVEDWCVLGGVYWTDIKYIAPLEDQTGISADILSTAGSYRFDEAYPVHLEKYAVGPEREALSYNSDYSGAYCGWVPTDVRWSLEDKTQEEKYFKYEGIWQDWLENATFSANVFPYEQLTEEEVAAYEQDLAEALQKDEK